jgi:hypothetical protein
MHIILVCQLQAQDWIVSNDHLTLILPLCELTEDGSAVAATDFKLETLTIFCKKEDAEQSRECMVIGPYHPGSRPTATLLQLQHNLNQGGSR